MKEKYEILFIEDRARLHKDQLSYFHYSLEYFTKIAAEKKEFSFFNVVKSVGELSEKSACFDFQIRVKKTEDVKVTVRSILFPVKTEGDKECLLKDLRKKQKEGERSTLFVVDLSLNPDDPTNIEWGIKITEQLNARGNLFFKMTGTPGFDKWQDHNFIRRATANDDVMVDDYPAAIKSPLFNYLEKNYLDKQDDCYQFLSHLLRSGIYNHQYIGGVLTKLIVSSILPDISSNCRGEKTNGLEI